MAALAFGLALGGLLLLALAMDRHHRDLFGVPPGETRRRASRMGGAALVGLSFTVSLAHWGVAIGPVAWCGIVSLTAGGAVALLTVVPRR